MLATIVAFVGIHVHTKSFSILHHVLRIMDEIETLTFSGAGFLLLYLAKKVQRSKKRNRRTWDRQWVKSRPEHGVYNGIMRELRETDPFSFKNFVRMNGESFSALLDKVSPLIEKQDINMRKAIPPGERLALTLRFLATGL